jgi:hypothetical protein
VLARCLKTKDPTSNAVPNPCEYPTEAMVKTQKPLVHFQDKASKPNSQLKIPDMPTQPDPKPGTQNPE